MKLGGIHHRHPNFWHLHHSVNVDHNHFNHDSSDFQDIENERHLLALQQVSRAISFVAPALQLKYIKAPIVFPAMDDRGGVTEAQANAFFEHSCPAVATLRLAVGAQVPVTFILLLYFLFLRSALDHDFYTCAHVWYARSCWFSISTKTQYRPTNG